MITSSSPNPAASYHIRPFRDARPGLLLLLQCRVDREEVSSLLVHDALLVPFLACLCLFVLVLSAGAVVCAYVESPVIYVKYLS